MAFDANDLLQSEHFVIQRTREGAVADFSNLSGGDGSERTVRAGFLRKLLMAADEGWAVQLTGVRIKGAIVEGELDLAECAGPNGQAMPALSLENCVVEGRIDINNARIARLSFNFSRIAQVNGRGAMIEGPLSFAGVRPGAEGEASECWLCFRNAVIKGDCSGRGARLVMGARAPDGVRPFTPLDLEGARIEGSLYLDKGGAEAPFSAKGAVTLTNARLGGSLFVVGDLSADSGDRRRLAFDGRNLDVAGDANMGAGCKLNGKLDLSGAGIGKNLDLREAEISGGEGLSLAHARVAGSLLLEGANIKGETMLQGARIEGDLRFAGGRFINAAHWAISAAKAAVRGDVSFRITDGPAPHGRKTVIEGGADLQAMRIGGALIWENLALRGPGPDGASALLRIADAVIEGSLCARSVEAQADARIDASGASCCALEDDVEHGWGQNGSPLILDGLAYVRLASDAPWRKRLAWLRRAQRFSPQPYATLARAYAGAGRSEDARRISLAQHDAATLHRSPGPISWVLSSLFGLIAGYGHAPLRMLRALAAFIALGVFGVLSMNAQGALVNERGGQCNGAVEPALYALDVALPLIDLGQQSACAPGRTARADLPAGVALGESDWRLFEGVALWRWFFALYALFGAVMAVLAVITFSGVLRPKAR